MQPELHRSRHLNHIQTLWQVLNTVVPLQTVCSLTEPEECVRRREKIAAEVTLLNADF